MAKAQGTMEFLMNYSWALIIIGIALAALVALGIFNPMGFGSTSGQSGFSGIAPVAQGFALSSGGVLSLKVQNTAGVAASISSIVATPVTGGSAVTYSTAVPLNSGSTSDVLTFAAMNPVIAAGSKYTLDVVITYTASGITHTSTGTIYGVV
jgi:hypothetical protein